MVGWLVTGKQLVQLVADVRQGVATLTSNEPVAMMSDIQVVGTSERKPALMAGSGKADELFSAVESQFKW